MTVISQTVVSDAFSWMKKMYFWLKFHWSLFLRVELTITQHSLTHICGTRGRVELKRSQPVREGLTYVPPLVIGWDLYHVRKQATGLDAWASRVKCPARFVSHLHDICIYIWVVYSLCFFCCLFITVTWWYVWCIEWASGNQEEVQARLVTLWLFIISCYSLYKTTLGLLCSWFEINPHFHKYSMDFDV